MNIRSICSAVRDLFYALDVILGWRPGTKIETRVRMRVRSVVNDAGRGNISVPCVLNVIS